MKFLNKQNIPPNFGFHFNNSMYKYIKKIMRISSKDNRILLFLVEYYSGKIKSC